MADIASIGKDFQVELGCAEQGVAVQLVSQLDAIVWFESEKQFWAGQSALAGSLIVENQNFGEVNLARSYGRFIQSIIDGLQKFEPAKSNEYFAMARDFRAIIGQGTIGQNFDSFTRSMAGQEGTRARLIFATALSQGVNPTNGPATLYLVRATFLLNPWLRTSVDVLSATEALNQAEQANSQSKETAKSLDRHRKKSEAALLESSEAITAALAEKISALTADLDSRIDASLQRIIANERLFNDKLMLMAPSVHWGRVASSAGSAAAWALGIFVLLLGAPFLLISLHWPFVHSLLLEIIAASNGSGLSLTGLAAITVPVLAYGWLLRHVSRVFVQNLALQADARHRRVMATTYLGLARIKAAGVTEAERALVMNALFRSPPPHAADDGPPAGLLELLKSK